MTMSCGSDPPLVVAFISSKSDTPHLLTCTSTKVVTHHA